jgi:hypothetical protein
VFNKEWIFSVRDIEHLYRVKIIMIEYWN